MNNPADTKIIEGGLAIAIAAVVIIVGHVREHARTDVDKSWRDGDPRGISRATLVALLLAAAGFVLVVYGAVQLLKI